MDALPDIPGVDPVVALDDNGDLILEAHDIRICNREPDGASQLKARMLILRVPVEMSRRRFEDGWSACGRKECPPDRSVYECAFITSVPNVSERRHSLKPHRAEP